jgi:predicted amidohydrolase YtcJ
MKLVALLSDSPENFDYYLREGPYKTDRLNVNGFKLYADGALGSRGACLLQPYHDKPGWSGFLLGNSDHYEQVLKKYITHTLRHAHTPLAIRPTVPLLNFLQLF